MATVGDRIGKISFLDQVNQSFDRAAAYMCFSDDLLSQIKVNNSVHEISFPVRRRLRRYLVIDFAPQGHVALSCAKSTRLRAPKEVYPTLVYLAALWMKNGLIQIMRRASTYKIPAS